MTKDNRSRSGPEMMSTAQTQTQKTNETQTHSQKIKITNNSSKPTYRDPSIHPMLTGKNKQI